MAYIFFQDVLGALGKKLNYESVSNLYGNSFAKDADKIIQKLYPLRLSHGPGNSAQTLLGMSGKLTIIESGENQKDAAKKALGDMSWFEEYLK